MTTLDSIKKSSTEAPSEKRLSNLTKEISQNPLFIRSKIYFTTLQTHPLLIQAQTINTTTITKHPLLLQIKTYFTTTLPHHPVFIHVKDYFTSTLFIHQTPTSILNSETPQVSFSTIDSAFDTILAATKLAAFENGVNIKHASFTITRWFNHTMRGYLMMAAYNQDMYKPLLLLERETRSWIHRELAASLGAECV
jgi:hypothetical protein